MHISDITDTIDRVEMLLIELQKAKTIPEFLDHFGNQYYIYGKERSELSCWASALRSAIEGDSFHFKQVDGDPEYARFMKRHERDQFHRSRRAVTEMFKDVSEYSCYVVEEAEQMDVVLDVLKEAYYRWKREDFKSKLHGDGDVHNW